MCLTPSCLLLAMDFPRLPDSILQPQWSPNTQAAHQILKDIYKHAIAALWQENPDPLQLSSHIDVITSDAVPLLVAIEEEGTSTGMLLPDAWLHECATLLGDMVIQLRYLKDMACGRWALGNRSSIETDQELHYLGRMQILCIQNHSALRGQEGPVIQRWILTLHSSTRRCPVIGE